MKKNENLIQIFYMLFVFTHYTLTRSTRYTGNHFSSQSLSLSVEAISKYGLFSKNSASWLFFHKPVFKNFVVMSPASSIQSLAM